MGGGIVWQGLTAPGPTTLRGGNLQAGFYGECPTSEFITGDELARMIGLTAGKSQYSTEPWLKFSYLGKIEFVAKKPFRCAITWNDINAVNAVFGDRTIEIKGNTYKVRLMKGKTEGKQDDTSEYKGDICKDSEWRRLMGHIHVEIYPNWNTDYGDEDIATHIDKVKGSASWCQEYGSSSDTRLCRGDNGVLSSHSQAPSFKRSLYGWRPVLELVD